MYDPVLTPGTAAWNNTHSDPNINNQINGTACVSDPAIHPTAEAAYATFTTTGRTIAQLSIAKNGILDIMKRAATLSVESGVNNNHNVVVDNAKLNSNPFPIVVLVSGAGGNGKDTFIEAVGKHCAAYNLSSITEVKEIANILVDYTTGIEDEMPICPSKHLTEKTDNYRQFLHDLKMAWSKFCDGPNYRLLLELREVLSEQINGLERYDVIFLHVREGNEIDRIKKTIEEQYGIIALTMIVKGLIAASDYVNDCDSNVDNYAYDLTIINTPNQIQMFELQAMLFANNLKFANKVFGIENVSGAMYQILQDATGTTTGAPVSRPIQVINPGAYDSTATQSTYVPDPNVQVTTMAQNRETAEDIASASGTSQGTSFPSNMDHPNIP